MASPVFLASRMLALLIGAGGPLLLLELHIRACRQHRVCVRTGIFTRVLQREVSSKWVKQPLVVVFYSVLRLLLGQLS